MGDGSRLEGQALTEEKRKDYRNVVLLQVALLLISLLGSDLLQGLQVPAAAEVSWFLFLVLAALYLYMLWDLLRNFTRKRWLIRAVQIWIALIYVLIVVVDQVLAARLGDRHLWNAAFHAGVLAVEILVLRLALRDLFRGARSSVEKLWASAAIYFMAGLAFTNLYRILHLNAPEAFGAPVNQGFSGYYEALYFSFSALVGLDNAFPQCCHSFRNLMLLEGVLGQLYLVLLISRVLLPDGPAEQTS